MTFRNYLTSQISRNLSEQSVVYKLFFSPLAAVFFIIVFFRNKLYDFKLFKARRLSARLTWSVGNLSFGGTGKTPFEVWMLQSMLSYKPDLNIIVLSRGYGSKLRKDEYAVYKGGHLTELYSDHFFDPMADEARLVSKHCPNIRVVVGRRRKWAYETFLRETKLGPVDLVILDDGLQHRSIMRDLDILIMSKDKPLANGMIAPLGMLRELPSMLQGRRVVSVLVDSVPGLESSEELDFDVIPGECFSLGRVYKNLEQAQAWCSSQKEVIAVLGIARPKDVVKNWIDSGLSVSLEQSIFLDDHQQLSEILFESLRQQGASVITTEKDYYRNKDFFIRLGVSYFVIEQELIDRNGRLKDWLGKIC